MIHSIWPSSPIFMIEANADHKERLLATGFPFEIGLLGNESRTVTYFRAPVSVDSGAMQYADTGNGIFPEATASGVHKIFQRETRVMHTLDSLARGRGQFDLLKLDVQGAEIMVLQGATNVLRGVHFVQLELAVVPYNIGAPLWTEVQAFMHRIGFEPYDLLATQRKKGVLIFVDVLFVRHDSPFRKAAHRKARLIVNRNS